MRIIKITHNNLSLCILYSVMNKRCNMKGSILPKRMLLLLVLLRFLRVLTRGANFNVSCSYNDFFKKNLHRYFNIYIKETFSFL